jgi:cell division protein FtsW
VSGGIAALRSGFGVGSKRKSPAKPRKKKRAQPIEYQLVITATMCLVAFGAVMVFSASSTSSLLGSQGDGAFYLKRTLMFGAIGLVALHLLARARLQAIRQLTPMLLAGTFCLLILVLGMPAVNGAKSWIVAGPVQVQPSEIMKMVLLYGAHLIAARPKMTDDLRSMMPYLVVVAGAFGLFMLQPDFGTTMVTALGVGALLIAGGAKIRHLALIAAVIAFFCLIAVMIEPYRMARLTTFLHPGADPSGAGFQTGQASIALGSGGLFGVGLGESVQKAFYLPEAHTDMISAVIGEEIGFAGITVLVGLYMLIGYGGFRTAQRAKDRYGKLLAAGITAIILIQASINLYAAMGMAPLTGVTLPFVSYGNSSLIVTLASVGLLLNVANGGTAALASDGRASSSRSRRGAAPRSRPALGGLRVVDGERSAPRPQAKPSRSSRSSSGAARKSSSTRSSASRSGSTRRTASSGGRSDARGDRGRRDSRSRGAGAGRRRRAR